MKPGPLVALIALAWAFEGNASAQAITSTVQLTQQSMDSTKSASKKQSVHIYGGEVQQAAPTKPGSVQAFYNVNRLNCNCAKQPVLSMNPGQIAFGTQVTLTSPSTNATIYYTTDGWTPTNASNRYIGPISIVGNTRLQAIAEEPGLLPSPIVEASYTVDAPAVPLQPNALAVGTVLVKGTPLRLITVSRTSSKSAAVGDRIISVARPEHCFRRSYCGAERNVGGSQDPDSGTRRNWRQIRRADLSSPVIQRAWSPGPAQRSLYSCGARHRGAIPAHCESIAGARFRTSAPRE